MGTIIRLVKEHSQQTEVGCFSNIYQSVLDLEIDNFLSRACKQMLLYPRRLNDDIFQKLTLNINYTSEANKFITCLKCKNGNQRNLHHFQRCRCGEKIKREVEGEYVEEVFFNGQPSFNITDDMMVVQSNSTDVYLKLIKDLGYADDVEKLDESLLVIGSKEVLILLDCLFSSETPLTDAFLRKQSSRHMNRLHKTMTHGLREIRNETESDLLTFRAVVRKQDKKVLYFECCEDFVNLLFQFLVVPLEFVVETCGDDTVHRCIINLFRSFKALCCDKNTKLMSNSTLPWYYSCEKNLLDINTESDMHMLEDVTGTCRHCAKSIHKSACKGFVKGNMKFIVSDDLIITPLSSILIIGYLKKLQLSSDDVEKQEISIGKAEVNCLLRTSLMTSTVLTTALWNLLVKKPKEET